MVKIFTLLSGFSFLLQTEGLSRHCDDGVILKLLIQVYHLPPPGFGEEETRLVLIWPR